jgi:uncharacterized membrane protein
MVSWFSGLTVQPRLKVLHMEIYGVRSTPQQRIQAGKSVRLWESVAHVSNVGMILGLWVYVWEISAAGVGARFVPAAKFRG